MEDSSTDYLPALAPANEDEVGEYFFESDPLALQSDRDYQKLLKALVKLQGQRVRAIKDLERIQEVREDALKDPLLFVDKLIKGDYNNLPGPQNIEPIPDIDLERYNIPAMLQFTRPKTRNRNTSVSENYDRPKDIKSVLVRGRVYNESKPQTFNQPWSDEEQRRLDELLIKYPDEGMASRRYVKISKELGTRTPIQVQSRVQKYFLALKREGLPVPGRSPRFTFARRTGKRRGIMGDYSLRSSSSSFMTAFNITGEEQEDGHSTSVSRPHFSVNISDVSDEEDISPMLRNTEDYKEIIIMKKVKKMKVKENETGKICHPGFSCDKCHQNPVQGTRWHCTECPTNVSTDFCDDCVKQDHSSATHLPSHILKPVKALCIKDTLSWLRENAFNE